MARKWYETRQNIQIETGSTLTSGYTRAHGCGRWMNTENSAGKEEHPTPQAIFKGRPTSHFDPHLGRFLGAVHGALCTVSSGVFGLQGGYGSVDRGGGVGRHVA